jgi:hypothetical protein
MKCHCGSEMVERMGETHCAATLATFKARHGYEYGGGPTVHIDLCQHGTIWSVCRQCSARAKDAKS